MYKQYPRGDSHTEAGYLLIKGLLQCIHKLEENDNADISKKFRWIHDLRLIERLTIAFDKNQMGRLNRMINRLCTSLHIIIGMEFMLR